MNPPQADVADPVAPEVPSEAAEAAAAWAAHPACAAGSKGAREEAPGDRGAGPEGEDQVGRRQCGGG